MMLYNKVTMIGRLTRDPEVIPLKDEKAITKLVLKTAGAYPTEDGGKPQTITITAIVRGKKGENSAKVLKKGSLVLIESKFNMRDIIEKNADGAEVIRDGRVVKKSVPEFVVDVIKFLDKQEQVIEDATLEVQ